MRRANLSLLLSATVLSSWGCQAVVRTRVLEQSTGNELELVWAHESGRTGGDRPFAIVCVDSFDDVIVRSEGRAGRGHSVVKLIQAPWESGSGASVTETPATDTRYFEFDRIASSYLDSIYGETSISFVSQLETDDPVLLRTPAITIALNNDHACGGPD
ncbi:MAG: hypothetical protein PVI86_10410 [Phycisphaerae bacterium]|jgi:hypothetical protein